MKYITTTLPLQTKNTEVYPKTTVFMVRVTGVEPARREAREPKSRMSANSIIPAKIQLPVAIIAHHLFFCQSLKNEC